MERKMELLAPVGGREQLLAAVRSGATAVYLGGKGFNARRNAENFGEQSLEEAVSYCHARGVAVHVTLNTLFLDSEREAIIEEIKAIAHSGADAVLVQDLGAAELVRQICPQLALHASTQLSTHSVEGVRQLEEMGFSQVVLAREVTAEEIRAIRAATHMKLEVFVHGALCMSMSGQCYLSSLIGERSGNRGLCAQPCRLNFKARGREYALSLKDLSLISRIEQLRELGVDSLKIEGRMKRPEYVAAAVTACRQALDGQTPELERLQAVFSRSGFTDGYLTGKRDLSMFGIRRKEDVTAAAGVLGELAALYRGENPLVPVKMHFEMEEGRPASLTVTSQQGTQVQVEGPEPQLARTRPTDEALVRRSMEKCGGTPYYLGELETCLGEGLMLPVSALNAMRSSALEQLLAKEEASRPHPVREQEPQAVLSPVGDGKPTLWIRLEQAEQLSPEMESQARRIILPVEELEQHPELMTRLGEKLVGELPVAAFQKAEEHIKELLPRLKAQGLATLMVGNLAAIHMGREAGFRLVGDYSLNILNRDALEAYKALGVEEAILSFELNLKAARKLSQVMPAGVIGYGNLPLMIFRSCPAKGPKGCGGCSGRTVVTDRLGNDFPLLCHHKQYSQLLNMVPLYLGDKQSDLRGMSHAVLRFTTEDPARCAKVFRLWQQGTSFDGKRTGGLYYRELK